MKVSFYLIFIFSFLISSCKSLQSSQKETESLVIKSKPILVKNLEETNDTTFVNLKEYDANFVLDMKYATLNNFLKTKVYDCAECYLRYKTVRNLINANKEFQLKSYSIKIFDCYRPLDVQKKMWELVPNPDYVANPKTGSIHNRGGAVDITIVDANGKELDMGTEFDFFGPEAAHNYEKVSNQVKINRAYLKQVMLSNNFKSFDSEWWHYNLIDSQKDPIANFKWKCE